MHNVNNHLRLPSISLGLLLLLVALTPYAMRFPAFDFYAADALSLKRTLLIIFGLLAALISFSEFIFFLIRYHEIFTTTACAAASLACAVIGWRSYPYWATGVYQVRIGAHSFGLQDPKDLAPMTWIGEFWRLPVLLLYLVCYVAVPLLLVISVIAIRRRRYGLGITIGLCMAIVLVFMVGFSPGYIDWIMD